MSSFWFSIRALFHRGCTPTVDIRVFDSSNQNLLATLFVNGFRVDLENPCNDRCVPEQITAINVDEILDERLN
ncbi:hypothetical protein PENTCL1PPCAC_27967 [Pristionchus entomophagus]|uniref:Uncharacterized protein n=1 Tax=Pristionchus entomophagus TaxID=358040 RepID=A0AAV5UGH4_9BILA|nr:hypothetical protein PENTCL1PPCAC_27967 [Pristionchus entomophagus]